MAKEYTKFVLSEDQMPTRWYNVLPDLPTPLPPPLHPGTHQPIGPDDLAPILPMGLIMQEVSSERWIEIPDEVQEVYKLWRPSPLYRARRLEKALDTPAHIYYKWEGVSPVGSHKPNTAIAQCYYAKKEGVTRLTTETGAGQWGSALSMAAAFFGLKLTVYMVKVSYHQKPYRRVLMQSYGAEVIPSPSDRTHAGRMILEQNPNHMGSLGLAISEGVEDAASHDDSKYSLGSALNFVLMHQTVIGLEAKQQMEMAGEYPDILIGCCGGGSNYGGFMLPFLADKLAGARPNLRSVAVEPSACPSLTRGKYVYDFADTAATAPLLKMHTLGHTFMPPGIHAGGLRYHGDSPIICLLYDQKVIEAAAYPQVPVFDAAVQFAKAEGFLPAPESGHALKHAIVEALQAKEAGESRVILFNMSGHGLFDLGAYDEYLSAQLQDYEYPQEAIEAAMASIPQV